MIRTGNKALDTALEHLEGKGYRVTKFAGDDSYLRIYGKRRGAASVWPEQMEYDRGGQITDELDGRSRAEIRYVLDRAGLSEIEAYA